MAGWNQDGEEASMVAVHSTLGTLVILGYLATTILYLISGSGPRRWVRPVSGIAAVLLLTQYVIGFSLLGEGHRIAGLHYTLAFLALVTVGLEHAVARPRGPRAAALASAGTVIIVILTYLVGQGTL
jgi:hypothetical protein